MRLEKRFSDGLNFQAYYTLAKTLAGGAGDNPYIDWCLNKARTADQNHNFTATMNYEVPVGKGRHFLGQTNRLVDALLGGYNVMCTYTIASGHDGGHEHQRHIRPGKHGRRDGTTNVGVPQYPGYMPSFGGVICATAAQSAGQLAGPGHEPVQSDPPRTA